MMTNTYYTCYFMCLDKFLTCPIKFKCPHKGHIDYLGGRVHLNCIGGPKSFHINTINILKYVTNTIYIQFNR